MTATRPRGMAALGLIALLVLLAACSREPAAPQPPPVTLQSGPSASAAPAAGGGDWTTYHRDNARSGYLPDLADPSRLTKAWSARLDGAVYAQPLVVGDRVLVATEADSLYSLSLRTGQVQWRTTVGEPVPLSELPCGNIDPLGITGTPVFDPATGLVFAVAEVSGPAHVLVGVEARTGRVRVRRSADVAACPLGRISSAPRWPCPAAGCTSPTAACWGTAATTVAGWSPRAPMAADHCWHRTEE